MTDDSLLVSQEGAVATIAFNRPERRNAITIAMWRRLADELARLAADDRPRVVVFRGAGREAFSAGADIGEFAAHRASAEQAHEYNRLVSAAIRAVAYFPKPTISLVRGPCIGGGCQLAVATDIRYAADDAQFGIPAAKLGIGIAVDDVQRLVALIGPAAAYEILYTGRRLPASRALGMGLVNAVYPGDDLEREVGFLAQEIAENAPLSVRWCKDAIRAVVTHPAPFARTPAHLAIDHLFDSDDYREGVLAFLEKRRPRFAGH